MISAVIFTPQWFAGIWHGILLSIDYVIYLAIDVCYQVFEYVSRIEVFSTEHVAEITSRIYTILGIVMLFVFAYNIILSIVNPDNMNKGDRSMKSIVQNTVISIVMVTLFPLVCEYLQVFQNHIIRENTIGKLIMGDISDSNSHSALNVATTIFTAFYHPVNENKEAVTMVECADPNSELAQGVEICAHYNELASKAGNSLGDFAKFLGDQDLKDGIYEGDMEYLFPLSTIAGVVAAYLFLSFSLDLGVRAAKLGLLKIIAPVPIFLRITKPKGGQFDKWFSDFSKTYLQVFERVVIIYFAMLLISYLSDIIKKHPTVQVSAGETYSPSVFIRIVGMVIIILGILKFAKDAPKMLEDVFMVKIPAMRIKDKLNDNEYAKRALTTAGVASGAFAKSAFGTLNRMNNDRKNYGFGKAAAFALPRLVSGAIRGVTTGINAGRRGWQNGNVSDWRDIGNAITTGRTQHEADVNNVKNNFAKVRDTVKNDQVGATIKNSALNALHGVKDFVNADGSSNEKLTAAKNLQSSFDTLFNNFIDKHIEDAKNSALKDYRNGKSVKFSKEFWGKSGTKYNPGDSVPVTELDPQRIKKHFEVLQRVSLTKKFNDDIYRDSIKQQGKIICKQMEKAMNVLGNDVISGILTNHHVNSIEELNSLFDKVGKGELNTHDMEKLRNIASDVGDQVKANSFANTVEKQKDKK